MENITTVNRIIASLQEGKWEDHSPQMLISAQGKLSSYLGNIGMLVADAEYTYRMLEANLEQYEIDKYANYRKSNVSQMDAKNYARVDAFAKETAMIEAKRDWQRLRAILKAMETLAVACSTSLKHMHIDRMHSGNHNN